MNPAVLSAISYVIRRCKKAGVETSICGQAGSKLEMVKFLVQNGIDSISTNADAAEKVSKLVARIEGGEKVEIESEKENVKIADKAEEPLLKMEGKKKEVVENFREEEPVEKAREKMKLIEDEYNPGLSSAEGESDIPALNDAIPVDEGTGSGKDEFNLEKELSG